MKVRYIVALSGGIASAWVADYVLKHYPKERVILYFNDTKWEHEDLYRFLKDLSTYWNHPITHDSDGRSPEELFWDNEALANNRTPFCSRILKAERLQRFVKDGDRLFFGIGKHEEHRADRIRAVYKGIKSKKHSDIKIFFPLLDNPEVDFDVWLEEIGIQKPLLYSLGFKHNNCSGGCVRAGIGQWTHLYKVLPEVYEERQNLEAAISEHLGKPVTFLPRESLKELRDRIESNTIKLPQYEEPIECIGICSTEN